MITIQFSDKAADGIGLVKAEHDDPAVAVAHFKQALVAAFGEDGGRSIYTNRFTAALDRDGAPIAQAVANVQAQIPAQPVPQQPESWGQPPVPAYQPGGAPATTTAPQLPAAAQPQAQQAAPMCAHGPRVYRTGTNDRGEWKAWFCSGPQSLPREQKCKAQFVRD